MRDMKPSSLLALVVLLAVALAHLLRLVYGARVTVADAIIPMWVSVVAVIVAGGVAFMLWRDSRG